MSETRKSLGKIMRILHLSALPVWSLGGKGGMPSLRESLKGHLRAGHEIVLLLPRYEIMGDEAALVSVEEDPGYEVRLVSCVWAPCLASVRRFARRIGGGKEFPYLLRWILNLFLYLLLTLSFFVVILRLRMLEKKNFDLIYAHNQFAALGGWLAGFLFRAPNVTRLYGTFLADLMKKPFVSLRYPTAAAGYLVPSDLLICANDGTRGDEVARKFGLSDQRFRFWQNGVEPPSRPPDITRADLVERFSPKLRRESKWALSCSRLSYWKRIDRMLQALAVCRSEGVDCQLVVAGDGSEEESLRSLAVKLGVSDNVVWLGTVAHDDVWALMNNVDVFMITNDVTNRCNPLYEAAWAGLPVISVHDCSTADLLRDHENALLSDKDDHNSLSASLAKLCEDSALSKKLSIAQKELAASFWTWEERMHVEVSELEKLVYGDDTITKKGR